MDAKKRDKLVADIRKLADASILNTPKGTYRPALLEFDDGERHEFGVSLTRSTVVGFKKEEGLEVTFADDSMAPVRSVEQWFRDQEPDSVLDEQGSLHRAVGAYKDWVVGWLTWDMAIVEDWRSADDIDRPADPEEIPEVSPEGYTSGSAVLVWAGPDIKVKKTMLPVLAPPKTWSSAIKSAKAAAKAEKENARTRSDKVATGLGRYRVSPSNWSLVYTGPRDAVARLLDLSELALREALSDVLGRGALDPTKHKHLEGLPPASPEVLDHLRRAFLEKSVVKVPQPDGSVFSISADMGYEGEPYGMIISSTLTLHGDLAEAAARTAITLVWGEKSWQVDARFLLALQAAGIDLRAVRVGMSDQKAKRLLLLGPDRSWFLLLAPYHLRESLLFSLPEARLV